MIALEPNDDLSGAPVSRRGDPMRLCCVTRESKPVGELLRFVVGPDGVLVPDVDGKAEGRGVWVTLGESVVRDAMKKKAFARSLKAEVRVLDDLPELTRQRLEQRLLGALGLCRKAGQIATGATKVRNAIEKGEVTTLFTATDAAADGRDKMAGALRGAMARQADETGKEAQVAHFELLNSDQLGLALGLENVIHAALTRGAAAQGAKARAERLARYIAG